MSAITKRLERLEHGAVDEDCYNKILVLMEKGETKEHALVRCGHSTELRDNCMFVYFVSPGDPPRERD